MNPAAAAVRRWTMTKLRGITWNHTRGYMPMVATAQRFSELFPDIEISWEKRSLQQFADSPIEKLADVYDLLVIDHPFAGYAAAHDVLLPLDEFLPASFLEDQASNSVGASGVSYSYGGHTWAVAVDAATPVCGYRRDLLELAHISPPRTWEDLLEMAGRGLVVVPAIGIDSLMNFYMLSNALGEKPFCTSEAIVSDRIGLSALGMLSSLISLCDASCLKRNPIATWDLLAAGNSTALCPFAYGYSNYGRPGYAANVLEFGPLIATSDARPFRSTLGGTGLAISSRAKSVDSALSYCEFVASAVCQRTLYFDSGGQPGHRRAWLDQEVNWRCGGFFANTLQTLDEAWLRPRYNGYLHFQDAASVVVHFYLQNEVSAEQALIEMNRIYIASRRVE
jgi:multiple sugar transport system substrate-binding protein